MSKSIIFARASGDETEVNRQVKLLRKYARKSRSEVVDTVCLPRASSADSLTKAAIQRLIERAKTERDFDVVLIMELSRLCRTTNSLVATVHALRSAGVDVRTITDAVPSEGEDAGSQTLGRDHNV